MACVVRLEQLASAPPYANGLPQTIDIYGRASADCASVRVVVRAVGPGSPIIAQAVVPVGFAPNNGADLPGLFRFQFAVPAQLGLACGDLLFIEAICAVDPSCRDARHIPVLCKSPPAVGPVTSPPGGGSGGWPPSRCFWSAASAAMTFLAALVTLGLAVALMNASLIAAAAALFAISAAAWALWKFWCAPSFCVQFGVLCWVFKRAFILSLPTLGFTHNAMTALLLIGYGAVAGILVHRLQKAGCPVPSARQPLTQLPI